MDRRGTENVPVESGEIITIDFSGGPQPGDAGPKDFWVIFNERDAYILAGGTARIPVSDFGSWSMRRTRTTAE
jgi:hypothetical protein